MMAKIKRLFQHKHRWIKSELYAPDGLPWERVKTCRCGHVHRSQL